MSRDRNIQNQINETINVLDNIKTVNVSPFFKDKTMNVLFAKKEELQTGWSWFTPSMQFATLFVIIALNVFALRTTIVSNYNYEVEYFAQVYDLKTTSEDNLFN